MKRNRISTLFVIIILFGFVSCNKQSPQLPSNKGNVADKDVVALLAINQNLATKEDSILQNFADKEIAFRKSKLGFWYKINQPTKGILLKDKDICKFVFQMKLLNGKVLEEGEKQIVIGKKQVVTGLEQGLRLMCKGDSATFIIPSNLAYGMKGNLPLVPPYTSLIFQIKLLK